MTFLSIHRHIIHLKGYDNWLPPVFNLLVA
jgi:hypothetical protein